MAIKPPARVKPLIDMQQMQLPPDPGNMSALAPDQQALRATMLYEGMTRYAGTCQKTREALIQWIDQP